MLNKLLCLFLLAGASTFSIAGAAPPVYYDNNNSIITPDRATGVYITSHFAIDSNGNLLICPATAKYDWSDNTCLIGKNIVSWLNIANSVPKGKTFVGFRINSRENIEIYWK